MTAHIPAPSLQDVDLAIAAGVRRLRFPERIERRFESDMGEARRKSVIFNNAIGLATYEAFLPSFGGS